MVKLRTFVDAFVAQLFTGLVLLGLDSLARGVATDPKWLSADHLARTQKPSYRMDRAKFLVVYSVGLALVLGLTVNFVPERFAAMSLPEIIAGATVFAILGLAETEIQFRVDTELDKFQQIRFFGQYTPKIGRVFDFSVRALLWGAWGQFEQDVNWGERQFTE